MKEIIAFISPKMDEALRQKIAKSLRLRNIKTTDHKENATLVICKQSDFLALAMTLGERAELIINNVANETKELQNQIYVIPERPDFPIITTQNVPKKTRPTQRIKMPTYNQYNATKQRFFYRTKCK